MRLTTVLRGGRYNSRAMRSNTQNAPPALEAKNISCFYESSGRGVSDVSLRLERGEVFGLMGPNGSGKSTLLRVLSTAIAPDSGSFFVGGVDGLKEKREVRARMGLMVDRPTHYDDLTGRANAYFFARAYGMEEAKAEGALAELFEYFDLAEYADDRVKTYSYGMGKKLALIEALAHGPEVLLLDEPSLGLAPLIVREVFDVVSSLRRTTSSAGFAPGFASTTYSCAQRSSASEVSPRWLRRVTRRTSPLRALCASLARIAASPAVPHCDVQVAVRPEREVTPVVVRERLRDREDEDSSRVSFVELFYDLIFVFAVTQLAAYLVDNITPEGVVRAGAVAQFGGKALSALMLDRTLNPGQLSIVREIVAAPRATRAQCCANCNFLLP